MLRTGSGVVFGIMGFASVEWLRLSRSGRRWIGKIRDALHASFFAQVSFVPRLARTLRSRTWGTIGSRTRGTNSPSRTWGTNSPSRTWGTNSPSRTWGTNSPSRTWGTTSPSRTWAPTHHREPGAPTNGAPSELGDRL